MPDDERKRRRLGDETKSRIADLASGWTVGSEAGDPDTAPEPAALPSPPAATPATATPIPAPSSATPASGAARAITDSSGVMAPQTSSRSKPKTNPPPPPGSPERKALEDKIIATTPDRDDPTIPREPTGAHPIVRAKGQTGQQPIAPPSEGDRSKPATTPPPPPGSPARAKGSTGSQPAVGDRAKGSTGSQPAVGDRAKGSTGSQPVVGDRAKGSTGSQPVVERSKPATTPPPAPGSPAHAKGSTGQQPTIGDRASSPSASPKSPAGQQPKFEMPDPSGWGAPDPMTSPSSKSGPNAAPSTASSKSSPQSSGATARPKPPTGQQPKFEMPDPGGWSVSDDRKPPTASGSLTAQQLPDKAPKAGPKFPRAGYDGPNAPFQTESKTFTSEQRTPPVIVDSSLSTSEMLAAASAAANAPIPAPPKPSNAPIPAPPKPSVAPPAPAKPNAATPPAAPVRVFPGNSTSRIVAEPTVASTGAPRGDDPTVVPTGEFDSSAGTLEQMTRRDPGPPAAMKVPQRDTPQTITPVEDLLDDDHEDGDDDGPREADPYLKSRGDPTSIDPQTNKFERGDPTQDRSPDATEIQAPTNRRAHVTGGTLRPSAALRRKRGLVGDVRYVFTAVFGVRQSRRELDELEHRQELRQTSRKRHLVTLGRTAIVSDAFDHPALGKARDHLQRVEEERGRHAGAVAASDAELERVRRDRETKAKEFLDGTVKADAELAELAKKLEPLEKEAAAVRRRAQELRETLQRVNKKIADTEALRVSVKAEKMDKAAIEADIATYKADREAVQRDEPVIAAELDALNPRIAAIEASRSELQKKKQELQKAEEEDQRRTSELLAAIGAKRKVVERAAAEAEQARDTTLLELGDKLYVDRPKSLATLLSPIDQIDLELGESDRRIMELREILSNIDRWKFSRGLAMIIVATAIAACFVWWLVAMLT